MARNSFFSMSVKVVHQAECNYRHLQDAIAMLPAATRELDGDARLDTLRALGAITAAVTGANPQLFFAVAEVEGTTAGFFIGALANFLLEQRTLAQDILLYVVPEHRGAGIASALIESFVTWARQQGASDVRFFLMNSQSEAALTSALAQQGFVPAGTVMALKLPSQGH